MKCLVVKQPWAELIARACDAQSYDFEKTIELRTWHLSYRGPLVIIAAARRARSPEANRFSDVGGQFSRAVALVELVDCRPATHADAAGACCEPGPRDFAWVLRPARRLTLDLHVKGQLSIFDPPRALARALEESEKADPVLVSRDQLGEWSAMLQSHVSGHSTDAIVGDVLDEVNAVLKENKP